MSKNRDIYSKGVLFVLLISLLSVTSIWIPAYAYVSKGNGHGTVVDNHGITIENVNIQIYDIYNELVDSEVTLSDGFFRLSLDIGTYKLVFDKPGYVLYEETIIMPSSFKSL